MDLIVYDNGQFLKASETSFSIFDTAFLSGEVARVMFSATREALAGLTEHWADLKHGASLLGVSLPMGEEEASRVILNLLDLNVLESALVSCILTREEKGWDPQTDRRRPRFWILASPRLPTPDSLQKEGVALGVCKTKVHPSAFPGEGRDVFRNPILTELHRKISESKLWEGLVLNLEGQVIGGTQSDVFVWKQGSWHTPSRVSGALDRVSRRLVLKVISKLGWECFESFMTLQDIRQAEECFIASPVWGLLPVTRLEKKRLGEEVPGLITQNIIRAHADLGRSL